MFVTAFQRGNETLYFQITMYKMLAIKQLRVCRCGCVRACERGSARKTLL